MNDAATADGHAAAILRSSQTEVFAQDPQQRLLGFGFNSDGLAVQIENDLCHNALPRTCASLVNPLSYFLDELRVADRRRIAPLARIPSPQDEWVVADVLN